MEVERLFRREELMWLTDQMLALNKTLAEECRRGDWYKKWQQECQRRHREE